MSAWSMQWRSASRAASAAGVGSNVAFGSTMSGMPPVLAARNGKRFSMHSMTTKGTVLEQRRDDDEPSGPLDVLAGAEVIEVVDDAELDRRQVLAERVQVFRRRSAVHLDERAQKRHRAGKRTALAPELAKRVAENVQALPRLQASEEDQVVVVDLPWRGRLAPCVSV